VRPAWFPEWSDQTVVIVASGPSAGKVELEHLTCGRTRVIAINESWRLAPWAEILYAGDAVWWRHARGCPDFRGIKVSIDAAACREWSLHRLDCAKAGDRIERRPGTVGWGGHSGFGALNLAIQLGVSRIALVGYDLTLASGLHWHGPHATLRNPREAQITRWRRAVDSVAPIAAELGIEIVNCSPISMLEAFPKMTLAQALGA
jgi:hypothetical protein